MIFTETPLTGAYLIDPEPRGDQRGLFARVFCREEFDTRGLETDVVQCNVAYNRRAGTLRGMHFQREPHAEVKLVRCTAGRLYDAIVDLRPDSPTFGRWFAAELTAANRRMLYVPRGFAHGYQTLADDTEIAYQVSAAYHPASEGGLAWDDPQVGIDWPMTPSALSDKDRRHPRLAQLAEHPGRSTCPAES
jgi:dTDP-4-dehydrorhamnose 3,5-epimerase